jgi:alpha-mannosidase
VVNARAVLQQNSLGCDETESRVVTTPESYSLLALSPTGCVLSAIKKAEDRDELILRLFNPSASSACDATLSVNPTVKRCCETDMNERLMGREDEGHCRGVQTGTVAHL